jgi:hypothetical protein
MRNLDWRDISVARTQAMRDLDAYAWAPRAANGTATFLAKLTIYGLTPICLLAFIVTRLGL